MKNAYFYHLKFIIFYMKLIPSLVRENFKVSLTAVSTNRLRSILTILIITFGIMALVGILTAIDALKMSITENFSLMGANTFSIQSRGNNYQVMGKRVRKRNFEHISFQQAMDFRERYTFPAAVTIRTSITGVATVKREGEQTNPNIYVSGVTENMTITGGVEIDKGRMISAQEVEGGSFVTVIGQDIVNALFKKTDPIDQYVSVGGSRYRVVGTFKYKGSGFGGGPDRTMAIPVTNARSVFSRPNQNFVIEVNPLYPESFDHAISEAEALFRQVRRLSPNNENDFNIERSDTLINMMLDMISYATIAAIIIGLITILGAAVGLMNIMLVSVSERTREIGTRKAIGAKSGTIKQQFLFESIVIGQIGGLLGIVLGIIIGNAISMLIGTSFIIPWLWILLAVTLCFFVSIASGYIPAIRAAQLDPIEALRYE
ncbi:MAG: ABC transporter permease [Prevotellaceae bacterium]|jgi:putative ABC transport system permease protein|nr:ABC transporter permease [Prevotellaceae bacterium]